MVFISVTYIFYQYCNKSFIWAKSALYKIVQNYGALKHKFLKHFCQTILDKHFT